MDKPNPIVGRGWRFPILPDAAGALGYAEGDESVAQCLKVLLLTALGERVMRPGFGSRAPQLVFFPGSEQYLGLLETTVREAVRDWEPRVDLEDVRAEMTAAGAGASTADPADLTRALVSISYRVRQTNTRNNLVFPFYLGTVSRA